MFTRGLDPQLCTFHLAPSLHPVIWQTMSAGDRALIYSVGTNASASEANWLDAHSLTPTLTPPLYR